MARGRPRKPGERYPSGELKRGTKPTTEPMTGTLWQRLRQHGKSLGLDERIWRSELGRLNFIGELTVAQTAAGHRIAEIYGRFERLNGLHRSAASPSYEISYGRAGSEVEDLGRDEFARRSSDAFKALQDRIAPHMRCHVEDLCVENRQVSPMLLDGIRGELEALALHFNVMRGAKGAGASPPAAVRRHTPLHFNSHEKPKGSAAAPARPRPNLDKIYWKEIVRRLRPDLDDDALDQVWEMQRAMKDRDIFRRGKG